MRDPRLSDRRARSIFTVARAACAPASASAFCIPVPFFASHGLNTLPRGRAGEGTREEDGAVVEAGQGSTGQTRHGKARKGRETRTKEAGPRTCAIVPIQRI
jgi:hypothetical protein